MASDEPMVPIGAPSVRAAVAAVEAGTMTRQEALLAVTPADLEEIIHDQFSDAGTPLAVGLGASPGAAVGAVQFSPDAAIDAYDAGIDVILVKDETSPEDVHGMAIAEGILTTKGGLASHAAVVARGWGKPAVVGASGLDLTGESIVVGSVTVHPGDIISIDGTSGDVFLGAIEKSEDDEVSTELHTLLSWADDIRVGVLGVRANVDNPQDAAKALDFGAEGIGLCRTEHQFLGDRLPDIRAMILASTPEEEEDALARLEPLQKSDFVDLLKVMDGLPVTVRLLDPPLHEFLPDIEDLIAAEASGEVSDRERALLGSAREWQETNPMLGTRGVRLGILRSGLYRMQVRALLQAASERRQDGGEPQVEIMVPLIVDRSELELVRSWIEDEIATVNDAFETPIDVVVGTMIETPRAAFLASEIAPIADFFSFGTNDLTQMMFGFSRDDVEARIIRDYLERGLLDANPFETLDQAAVGNLVAVATADARAANDGIKVGICGEHGGDPESVDFFYRAGLDYVSCSPFRVPIARLAAAQAILRTPGR